MLHYETHKYMNSLLIKSCTATEPMRDFNKMLHCEVKRHCLTSRDFGVLATCRG